MQVYLCDFCGEEIVVKEAYSNRADKNYLGFEPIGDVCKKCGDILIRHRISIQHQVIQDFHRIENEMLLLDHYLKDLDWHNPKYREVFGSMVEEFQKYQERRGKYKQLKEETGK